MLFGTVSAGLGNQHHCHQNIELGQAPTSASDIRLCKLKNIRDIRVFIRDIRVNLARTSCA